MSFDHTRKQGDTGDPLEVTLTDANGNYAIPAGSTVFLTIKSQEPGHAAVLTSGAMVADPDQVTNPGLCTYAWSTDSVATAGSFDFEVKVTLSNGKSIRFPRDEDSPYGTLLIQPNLS